MSVVVVVVGGGAMCGVLSSLMSFDRWGRCCCGFFGTIWQWHRWHAVSTVSILVPVQQHFNYDCVFQQQELMLSFAWAYRAVAALSHYDVAEMKWATWGRPVWPMHTR